MQEAEQLRASGVICGCENKFYEMRLKDQGVFSEERKFLSGYTRMIQV